MVEQPLLLTVPQVMARLQVSRHAVYELMRRRRLRSVVIGRCRRIPVESLQELVAGDAGPSGRRWRR